MEKLNNAYTLGDIRSILNETIDGLNSSIKTINGKEPVNGNIEVTGGINLLKRNTIYEVGQIAYSEDLPSWAYLECITAGTTAGESLDLTPVTDLKVGDTFTDGTVVWILKSSKEASSINPIKTVLYENTTGEKVTTATLSSSYYTYKGLMIITEDIENNVSFNTVAWTWQIDAQMETTNTDSYPVIGMVGALEFLVMIDPMTIQTSNYSIKKVYGLS